MQLEQKKRRFMDFKKNQRNWRIEESKQTRTNQDKEPEIKVRENIEEKLEHLGKQEKYSYSAWMKNFGKIRVRQNGD